MPATPGSNTIPLNSTFIHAGLDVGKNDPFYNAPLGIPMAGLSNPMQPSPPNPLVTGF